MDEQTNIVIYQTEDGQARIAVHFEEETVWLTQQQMADLFQTSRTNVVEHIRHIYAEGEQDEAATCRKFRQVRQEGARQVARSLPHYNLDLILSLGYRVKSSVATRFRRWATGVLKEYLVRGVAANRERLRQLGQAVEVMRRTADRLDAAQVLDVVSAYSTALELLDAYDHQTLRKPRAEGPSVPLTYEECRRFIDGMAFSGTSALFGREKDGCFKSAIGAIHQTFGGRDVYPSAREKAANLLYLVTKNHGFSDGNKRIAAALFLYYLQRNGLLLREDGTKRIADHTLVALTVMIAESKPAEKDMMVTLVMTFLA